MKRILIGVLFVVVMFGGSSVIAMYEQIGNGVEFKNLPQQIQLQLLQTQLNDILKEIKNRELGNQDQALKKQFTVAVRKGAINGSKLMWAITIKGTEFLVTTSVLTAMLAIAAGIFSRFIWPHLKTGLIVDGIWKLAKFGWKLKFS